MKLAAGSGVSGVAFTGLASADARSDQRDPNSSAEDLVKIGSNDDIGKTGNIEVTKKANSKTNDTNGTISLNSHGECRTLGDTWTIPVVGVDVGIEITFCPGCDITFKMTAVGQSTQYSVQTCGHLKQCEGSTLNGGVFKISTEECYYYDESLDQTKVVITGEICGVSLRHGWVCDSVERTYYEPQ